MTATLRERLETDQLVKIAAGWRCQACGAEHGKPHPDAPGVRVFICVAEGKAWCQACLDDATKGPDDA